MRDPIILLVHLIATLARLMGPGGLRSVVAESVLVKQQLLILNRSRHRAPNLCASDRILAGVCALFMRPARVIRSAIVLRPSTILEFHRALRTRKYRWLFSPTRRRTGPQGPSKALVDAIVDMKRRNPRWGCPRIAQQIALAFAVDIDKDVVRRVLATHYRPAPHSGGPSWLTFLGHAKDSLWSIDLFRCESAILRSHWVLVVMDQYTRRIVGFGIHAGTVDGRALCRMFNHAIRGLSRPKRLSSDHDPLYRFHQWRANLRVLQVTEVKSVPYVRRRWSERSATPGRSAAGRTPDAWRSSGRPSSPRPPPGQRAARLQLVHRRVQQLVLHQQLADLGLQPTIVFVPGIRRPALQASLARGQKPVAPLRGPRRGDPHRPRHRLEILPAQQTPHHLALPPH